MGLDTSNTRILLGAPKITQTRCRSLYEHPDETEYTPSKNDRYWSCQQHPDTHPKSLCAYRTYDFSSLYSCEASDEAPFHLCPFMLARNLSFHPRTCTHRSGTDAPGSVQRGATRLRTFSARPSSSSTEQQHVEQENSKDYKREPEPSSGGGGWRCTRN